MTISRDLAEIVETTFLVAGFLLMRLQRTYWAAPFLILALLSKETALLALACGLAAVAVGWLRRQGIDRATLLVHLAAVLVLALWQIWLWRRWGALPELAASSNRAPFLGLLSFVASLLGTSRHDEQTWLLEIAVLLLLLAVCCFTVGASSASSTKSSAGVCTACLF